MTQRVKRGKTMQAAPVRAKQFQEGDDKDVVKKWLVLS